MAKKRKVIKRVYESGRETTFPSFRRKQQSRRTPERSRVSKKPFIQTAFEASFARSAAAAAVAEPVTPSPARHKEQWQHIAPLRETYELPLDYETSRLTLMVRDPFWLYAYWDLTPASLAAARKTLGDQAFTQLVLRLYDVTLKDFNGHNANSYFDIEVGVDCRNWHINLWSDNVSYIGELGLRSGDGRFVTIARSNHIQTPRMSYSSRTETIWMKVSDERQGSPFVVAHADCTIGSNGHGNGHTNGYARGYAVKNGKRLQQPNQQQSIRRRTVYLSEDDIRLYYSRLNPFLRDIVSSRLTKRYGKKARSLGECSFWLEGDSFEERAGLFSWLPQSFFIRRIVAGASESLMVLASQEHVAGSQGASEYISQSLQDRVRQRKFFFELFTELIVYGRTEPDATVSLGATKVPLRPDGTFSMRFLLPDGKIPLEFKAQSADKEETRKIHTYVQRTTEYPL